MTEPKQADRKPAGKRKKQAGRAKGSSDVFKQAKFLGAYSAVGNIHAAAKLSGVDRGTHYGWLRNDPTYRERFEEAKAEAVEVLEEEARRRAVVGVEEPVGWHQGRAGGVVRKYSDTLLIFLLKGANPEKYRERIETRHTGGIDLGKMTEEQLAERAAALGISRDYKLPHEQTDGET